MQGTTPASNPGEPRQPGPRQARRGIGRRWWLSWTTAVVLAFSLLIWVKLRVVTGVPRAVYADPKPKAQAGNPANASNAADPAAPTRPADQGPTGSSEAAKP